MTGLSRWGPPLQRRIEEPTEAADRVEYEDFPSAIDVTGPLLNTLFHECWGEVELGYVIQGGKLEPSLTQPPKMLSLGDGYLNVVTGGEDLHLRVEEKRGSRDKHTSKLLRHQR